MNLVFTLLMVLIVISCVLLVVVIMFQNPKGGGLSSAFGGVSSATFGVQRTNDFMEKATWYLGVFITVLILLSVILTGKPTTFSQKVPAQMKKKVELPNAPQAPTQKLPSSTPIGK